MPQPLAAWYLFWLGAAGGMTLLAMSAYRFVSPRWLKWLLLMSGALVLSRYVSMALFATGPAPQALWLLRRCWFATSVGLTFPGVVALDQLVRHPAMSPKKLLQRFSPFLAVYALVLLVGPSQLAVDPVIGTSPRLTGWAVWLLSLTQTVFLIGFLWLGGLLIKTLPSQPIRLALAGLMAAYGYLGIDGLLIALGRWYFRPFLFSEILALAALWWAFETARHHPL